MCLYHGANNTTTEKFFERIELMWYNLVSGGAYNSSMGNECLVIFDLKHTSSIVEFSGNLETYTWDNYPQSTMDII